MAEAATRAKDDFLAVVWHELRTRLSAICGWVHVLRTAQPSAAVALRAVESVERNVKVQARLVEDLLDISRIVRGRLRFEVGAIDVRGAIEAALRGSCAPGT